MTDGLPERVSRSTAERILAAAAEHDATGDEMVDLRDLRTAAEGAGISAEAFDASVSELRRGSAPAQPRVGTRVSYSKIVTMGALGVAGAIAVVAQLPDPNAGMFGAALAGVGSVGAVIAYLRSVLPGRSPDPAEPSERIIPGRTVDPADL